jgi:flagellar motor switch protein FliM
MQSESPRRQVPQAEIDALFRPAKPTRAPSGEAARYDLLRVDRIPAPRLRAIHMLHENLARSLASSLSAYLRSFVAVNQASFEQLSYAEFLEGLPARTLVTALSLRPYDGSGVLEINPSLFFPVLETLLGGAGQNTKAMDREITEIEQRLMDGFLRIIVQHMRDVWKPIAPVEFAMQTVEKGPQFLQILAPTEAVVAIGLEVRLGPVTGTMNIALPSLFVKAVRQKFDQQWVTRKESSVEEQRRILHLVEPSDTDFEVCLEGACLSVRDLSRLREGDLLLLDLPADASARGLVNGRERFEGHMARAGRRSVYVVDQLVDES